MSKQQLITGTLKQALTKKTFQAAIIFPEDNKFLTTNHSLFTRPVFPWTPKLFFKNKIPPCPQCNRDHCVPKIKEYLSRIGQDFSHCIDILYIAYTCPLKGTQFTTITNSFLQKVGPAIANRCPFYFSHKTAITRQLFRGIHKAIMSPKGIARLAKAVNTQRMARYGDLLVEHAARVNKEFALADTEQKPQPWSFKQYMTEHESINPRAMQDAWLFFTSPMPAIAKVMMEMVAANKAIMYDASQKYPGKMRAEDPETHSLVTPQELKLVNIVQNEVGEIMAYDLLEKESHACLGPVLKRVKAVNKAHGIIPTEAEPIIVVCDQVTRDKKIIKAMGPHYKPKQDPFHLFQRINEKISGKGVTSSISNKIREALYYTEGELKGELKEHTQAAKDFKAACNTVVRADLNQGSDAWREWQGSVKNNTFLIANGFASMDGRINLHYEQDTHWKLLHSSGVESTNNLLSQLSKRKMGPKLAVWILYCFVVERNIEVGQLVGRIPNLYQVDILTLLKLPLLTNNLVAPKPQLDFALTIWNKLKETGEATRSKDPATILVSDWDFLYGVAQPRQSNENGVQTEQPAGPQTIQTFFGARNSTKAGPRELNALKLNAIQFLKKVFVPVIPRLGGLFGINRATRAAARVRLQRPEWPYLFQIARPKQGCITD
ncbi:hypothetical protein DFS34DRAFT_663914 [Phlyctochytrium arcticum]|nr:hypothetical protein DFS34DRAFT_663914 [Phlyctochytrium arcticum]